MANSTLTQSFNRLSLGKFGDLMFARQAPVLDVDTHRGVFAKLSDWRERRAAAAELAALSDRDLADIGLTRQEIHAAVHRKA